MKTIAGLALLTFVSGAVFTTPVLAQQPREQPQVQREQRDADARAAWQNREGLVESSRLVGMKIRNAEGKDVGEIDQLLVNPEDGKVSHAVIGTGGLLGIGETKLVMPWSDLKLSRERDGRDLVVQVDQAALDRAPRFDRAAMDRDRAPAASPQTTPRVDRDRTPAVPPAPAPDRNRDGQPDSTRR